MKKLIIQIPCYNEAESLPVTLAELPRTLPGVDRVEWLIIDDGSDDGTSAVAVAMGADHVVRLPLHQGLASAFMAGLDACIDAGADIIVNTDADNQYRAADIPMLIEPILAGRAEIVIGARPIEGIEHFSPIKKFLQRFGSWVVQIASRTKIADATSGFRAFSRDAAEHLHVFSDYTYTLETIIQAGQKGMAVISVPIRTNVDLRPSRLVQSTTSYIRRSLVTILRIFVTYRSFSFFAAQAAVLFSFGVLIGVRFLCYFALGQGRGHVQSLILSALLIGLGVFLLLVGLLADLVAVNRKLLERVDSRLQRITDELRRLERAFPDSEGVTSLTVAPVGSGRTLATGLSQLRAPALDSSFLQDGPSP